MLGVNPTQPMMDGQEAIYDDPMIWSKLGEGVTPTAKHTSEAPPLPDDSNEMHIKQVLSHKFGFSGICPR